MLYRVPFNKEEEKELMKVMVKARIKYSRRKLIIKEMWKDYNYKDIYENTVFRKRIEMVNDAVLLKPDLYLQGEINVDKRTKLFNFDISDPRLYSPALHRRVLPNEIVFDIEKKEIVDVRKILKVLSELSLNDFKAIVGQTRRGYHVHVWITVSGLDIIEMINYRECKDFILTLFELILKLIVKRKEQLKITVDEIDKSVMKGEHMIREFYSLHTQAKIWKVPIGSVKTYMESVFVVSELLRKRIAFEKLVKENGYSDLVKEAEQAYIEAKKLIKIGKNPWIEFQIKHPELWHDGRRRFLYRVLVPYLIFVKKMDKEQAFQFAMDWVMRTPRGDDNYFKSLIKSEINACFVKPDIMMAVLRKYSNIETFIETEGIEPPLDRKI